MDGHALALSCMGAPASVSVRIHPPQAIDPPQGASRVEWSPYGYVLESRPQFTLDPLFHAGCYYVQDSSAMFVGELFRRLAPSGKGLRVLDLCAAPGGKTTDLAASLRLRCGDGFLLVANEVMRQRASVLCDNVTLWGDPNVVVTSVDPAAFASLGSFFDVIVADVPCSGEGMFRKDEATIREWSPQQVEKCWQLQREIVADAWACLNEGGFLIYSTCTFNTKENEENIRWILNEYDAEVLKVEIKTEWNITGSLLEGFHEPVYRFIPGISRGEGLFMCVLHKKGMFARRSRDYGSSLTRLRLVADETTARQDKAVTNIDLSYQEAMKFLRGETLTFSPDTPRGIVEVSFDGHPLGQMKNIGTRANNLYPKEWRIKTTHIPTEYEPILKKI